MQTETLVSHKPLAHTAAAPGHLVQFYDQDEFPDQSICDYLWSGVRAGESAVVIATPEHVQDLRAQLQTRGIGLEGLERDGRLSILDAQATLNRFTAGGVLDQACAMSVLGAVLDQSAAAAPSGSGRAFGELVAVLAAQGHYNCAVDLERLWSQLLHRRPFQLYCAYPIQHFLHESMRETFQHICDEHDEVVPVLTWLDKPEQQGRLLAMLQQQSQALQREMGQRKQVETDLRASHEQLRALAAHLQSAREDERTRLARELHDELGQTLSVLKMGLSRWSRSSVSTQNPSKVAASQSDAHEMMGLTDQAIQSVRRILKELRPPEIDLLGLLPALEAQVQEFQNHTGIEAHFSSDVSLVDLDEPRALALYRIVQECLTNVGRHAGATLVAVTLSRTASHWLLEVRDNGKGLPAGEPPAGHWGILGMRERALLLGGTLEIHGASRQGTTVSLKIPLSARADGATRIAPRK